MMPDPQPPLMSPGELVLLAGILIGCGFMVVLMQLLGLY